MLANDPQTNHFAGILLTIFLATMQERVGRAGSFRLILFALPGTILHELAHFVVASSPAADPTA
ncbi:hypothetical protein [Geotalea toluenoxydans]|uniref:hypothetical protein n=1 Tax=Geotalea toluenoxydans TaxID=421624 RepID=UPI000A942DC7|nr:hypothetical protein [Geotalea toluenoxydans]